MLCKNEGLSSEPKDPCTNLSVVAHVGTPTPEDYLSLELTGQQSSPCVNSKFIETPCLKQKIRRRAEMTQWLTVLVALPEELS